MTSSSLQANYSSKNYVNSTRMATFSQHELFKANTGWEQSPEQYRENAKRRAELAVQLSNLRTPEEQKLQTNLQTAHAKEEGNMIKYLNILEEKWCPGAD